jgi:farnesyl diphosphate synthase
LETVQRSLSLEVALQNNARAVERMLDRLLPKAEGPEHRLLSAMRYATFAGGKRLRPFLVMSSSELFRVTQERALRVAAALECVHTYSLVHDDLPSMDDSDLRRGQPSLHVAFDEATAVLAGDALLTLAFEILSDRATHDDPGIRVELVSELAAAAGPRGMVGGQMIDLASEGQALDIGAINRLQHMKTGALISFAAEAGAILGHGSPETRQALKGYAQNLGLAFQITDDVLDAEGDPKEVGKQLGKDAKAKKATFLTILGADRAKMQAKMLADQAVQHLEIFGKSANVLRDIARFVVERRL